ncbi:MAG: DUF2167 domain-containing protein [Hyphomonadaceae bacterium]|nr:DUF2167 domain-containing protein [Hyphomonadaceae bacterium]
MRKNLTHAFLAALALVFAGPALADGPGDAGPDVAAPPVRAEPAPAAQPAAAEGRTGQILLDNVTLSVPQGYRFYSAAEAMAYLQRNNAATPAGTVLGLLAREGADIRRAGTWATVVSYDAIGYVQPETAAGLQDASFESDVRSARSAQSRVFEGFAAAPAFDAAGPTLTWAERAGRPGGAGPDLRFEQKAPGRQGVACLTSIGSADQMPEIQAAAADLRAMLSFPAGSRHADFQPATDQVSSYSVPGLVTGVANAQAHALAAGEAADGGSATGQTGFGGLAGWFPWVAVGIVVLAVAGYLMMRRREDDDEEEAEA